MDIPISNKTGLAFSNKRLSAIGNDVETLFSKMQLYSETGQLKIAAFTLEYW